MSDLVLAADKWTTNGHLIADVARTGHIKPTDYILDPTYQGGIWWKRWRPDRLEVNKDRHDFRALPYADGTFDVAAFDPPYVCPGGRSTSTIKGFLRRYGLDTVPMSPRALQYDVMNPGLTEMTRVVRPGGIVLMKCKDYVSSGHIWEAVYHTRQHAETLGLKLVDRFEHVGHPGPQSQTNQVHARRNHSTLFVFKTPRRRKPAVPALFDVEASAFRDRGERSFTREILATPLDHYTA